jgi:hypothetical protein
MNLGQLAMIVGQRLGNNVSAGTRDGNAIRAFLSITHDQLWRQFLWKDSIIQMTIPVNPATPYIPGANYMPSKGRVILPPIFQLVLGVNYGYTSLNVQRPMLYYRADYNQFLSSQYTSQYQLLSSCVWEFDTPQAALYLSNSQLVDYGSIITVDSLQSDEVTVSRSYATLNTVVPLGTTDRIDDIIIPTLPSSTTATPGTVSLVVNPPANCVIASGAGTPVVNGVWVPTGNKGYSLVGNPPITSGQENGSSSTYPLMYAFGAEWIITANTVLYMASPSFVSTPDQVTNWAAVNGSLPTPTIVASTGSYNILTLNSSYIAAPKCQRIQLVGKPVTPNQTNNNLDVLGKRTTPPFLVDTDIPGISGLDGILIAMAYYHFRGRDEQGGGPDAQAALMEAVGPKFMSQGVPGGWLGLLIKEEVVQAAYNTRIIPEQGFGGCNYYDEPFGSKSYPYAEG